MRKISIFIVIILAIVAGVLLYRYLDRFFPAIIPPPDDIGGNTTTLPFVAPAGFSIEIFAKNIPGARVMALDTFGNLWVSQTSEGIVSLIEVAEGAVKHQSPVLTNLRKPHGLAFDPESQLLLYVAEEHQISRIPTYSDAPTEKIIDLPSDGGHSTRTLGFGPEGRLYVSIGSSCNVCHENDERRAKIFTVDVVTKKLSEFARGLRNTVFFAWHPETHEMWGTDMGRDFLGDNLPPDEINIISLRIGGSSPAGSEQNSSRNFGWPTCYGKNIHDDNFDKNVYVRNPCMEPFETPSKIDIPAHSAPLGLAFIPTSWPEEYHDDLLVAYHGSWNRSEPTGYKIVRHKFDANGVYEGVEDFITGWLTTEGALGRPVDIEIQPNGIMYVSDDKAGVIYKISPPQEN